MTIYHKRSKQPKWADRLPWTSGLTCKAPRFVWWNTQFCKINVQNWRDLGFWWWSELLSECMFFLHFGPQTIGPRTVRPRGRNPPNDIYPPIVGRIYPITAYRFNWNVFSKCWRHISNTNIPLSKNILYQTLLRRVHCTVHKHPSMNKFNRYILYSLNVSSL